VVEDFASLDNSPFLVLSWLPRGLTSWLGSTYAQSVEQYVNARERGLFVFHDSWRRLALPDASVDHILCSHFLEHIYPDEATAVLRDFWRVLRPNGTLHIVLPSLDSMIDEYLDRRGDCDASDILVRSTTLSQDRRPTRKLRLLEALGYEGLKHRWMYDGPAMANRLVATGFDLQNSNETPSAAVRSDDLTGNLHLVGRKRVASADAPATRDYRILRHNTSP
jgi:predicted SAM-dependent methyltransferase